MAKRIAISGAFNCIYLNFVIPRFYDSRSEFLIIIFVYTFAINLFEFDIKDTPEDSQTLFDDMFGWQVLLYLLFVYYFEFNISHNVVVE